MRTLNSTFPNRLFIPQPAGLLITLWALGMIALPIGLWTLGESILPWAVSLTVLILASATVSLLFAVAAPGRALRAIAVVLIGGWLVEFMGSKTGIPFGHYDYTTALQPQIGGVPILIPLAWLMMLPSAWAVAQQIAPTSRWRQLLISGLAFTAWDLFLDPQMVMWNFWQWENPSGYFGIPWVNFLGWFISAVLLTWFANPPPLPIDPFLIIYTLTWALQTIGLAFFWNMPGPAFFGFIAMGFFVVMAWSRRRQFRRIFDIP
jgi:putative membrane protein